MPPKRSRATTADTSAAEPSGKKAKAWDTSSSSPGTWTKETAGQLTYDELRQALITFGESPGPISDATRPMYERMLLKRQAGETKQEKAQSAAPETSFATALSPPAGKQSPKTTGAAGTSQSRFGTSTAAGGRDAARVSSAPSFQFGSSWSSSSSTSASTSASAAASSSTSRLAPPVSKSRPSTVSPTPTATFGRKPVKPTISAQETRGLVAATYTPLTASGDINLPMIDTYADYLVESGVSGVFVNGTTGEGVKFSVDERKDLVEKWIDAASDRMSVFVHVGAESIKAAQEMAIHAYESGAHAIAVLAPTVFKPKTADHMVDYCAAVALAAPHIPMYYYHIPGLTGNTFSIEEFLDSARQRIKSFVGVKYSDADLAVFNACRSHGDGNLHLMYGKDEQLLAALAMGAETFVGSTYNLYPKLYHTIAAEFANGNLDKARELQLFSWQFIKIMLRYGGVIPAGRCILDQLGVTVGPPRVPDRAPDPANVKRLIQELRSVGFFDWA